MKSLGAMGVSLDRPMAEALPLCGGIHRHRRFRYSNTTARTPAGGGHMSGGRGESYPINKRLFETTRLCRLRLNAYLAQHLELLQGGKIALCPIPLEVERETGVTEDDMEDVSNFARNLEGVNLAVTFRTVEGGATKLSVRSAPGMMRQRLRPWAAAVIRRSAGATLPVGQEEARGRGFAGPSGPGHVVRRLILCLERRPLWPLESFPLTSPKTGPARMWRPAGFGTRRIGHGGNLDPMATGVLPIFVGRATRAVEFFESAEKEYLTTLRLGLRTDTQDVTGRVLETRPVDVTQEALEAVLSRFLGPQMQTPPMYSAVKVNGQKLYELARQGKEVERQPRQITIHELELLEFQDGDCRLRVRCSKGTYIRTLCEDIGRALGCGGCMAALRRSRAGGVHPGQGDSIAKSCWTGLSPGRTSHPCCLWIPCFRTVRRYN